jgi:hypothetical protein
MGKKIIALMALQHAVDGNLTQSEELRGMLKRATITLHRDTHAREQFERRDDEHGPPTHRD